MTLLLISLLILQTIPNVTGTERMAWDQDFVNTASFQLNLDGVNTGVVQATRTTGTNVWTTNQTINQIYPNMTLGNHTLIVSACNQQSCTNSDPLVINKVLPPPAKPTNFRIVIEGTLSITPIP